MPNRKRSLNQETKSGAGSVEAREAEALSALFALSASKSPPFKKAPHLRFSKTKQKFGNRTKARDTSNRESKVSKRQVGTKRKATSSNDYEMRRREQRRLSAQARREKKRNTLSFSEEENNKLSGKLDRIMLKLEEVEPERREKIKEALDSIGKRHRKPDYDAMLRDAKNKLMSEEEKEQTKAPKPKAKGKISRTESENFRRERNRLSAKLSRLRKRIRLEYLRANVNFFEHQLQYLKEHLYDFPTLTFPSPVQ